MVMLPCREQQLKNGKTRTIVVDLEMDDGTIFGKEVDTATMTLGPATYWLGSWLREMVVESTKLDLDIQDLRRHRKARSHDEVT